MEELVFTPEIALKDSLEGRRVLRSFERVVDKRLAKLAPSRAPEKVIRVASGGLQFYYQREARVTNRPYFTIETDDSRLKYEYGLEDGNLVRRVFGTSGDGLSINDEDVIVNRLSLDEARTLLAVMRKPTAFTLENPPGLMNLSPEEELAVSDPRI